MFLELILTLVTVSFFAIFALRPTLLTITELLKEIKTKEETATKMATKIQNLQQAQTLFTQEEPRIKLLETAVPNSPAPDTFVRQIEGLSVSHPINLLGISIGEVTLVGEEKVRRTSDELEKLPGEAKGISFSMSLSGDYQNIISFLSDMEKMRRPVKIDAINILSAETEEGQNLVLVVTGRTPYLKENSEIK